jgi:prepilin-type N-terminal cleavage/methylation domain-containing protein
MIRRYPERVRPDGRAGFTIVEILVALMISGLVVTSIFQIMQGNSRFVQLQSAREEVQQNARAALDIIAGDLRGVPPGAITVMDPSRIRFRQPRAWGILCNLLKPATQTAWVLFPADVLPQEDLFLRPNWGLGVEQTTDPLVHTGTYRFVSAPASAATANQCDAIQPIATAEHVRLGFNSGNPFVTSDSILPGTQVLVYEELQYDVNTDASGTVPGSWIRRMAGLSGTTPVMQPMAGPVPAGGALRFTYLQADGSTAAVLPSQIRQIGIDVVTQSRAVFNQGGATQPQVDSASTNVYLRNLPG